MNVTKRNSLEKQLKTEHVGLYGFGRTGQALVDYLEPVADQITVLDDAKLESVPYEPSNWSSEIQWIRKPSQYQEKLDRLIVSPGVPGDHPYLRQVRETGTPVWGSLELAYRISTGEIWGVTGTNGKSTTTNLLGEFMKVKHGAEAVSICGNNDLPFIESVTQNSDAEYFIVEVSSFQVEGLVEFSPDAVILTNLGEDHLDRHESLYEYHGLKWELIKRTDEEGIHVLPASLSDEVDNKDWLKKRPNVRFFSASKSLEGNKKVQYDRDRGILIDNQWISLEEYDPILNMYPENLLAIIAMVRDWITPDSLRKVLENFQSLSHRVEQLSHNGEDPTVINDSKATNPHATLSLLQNIEGPIRLVLGGESKNSSYDDLLAMVRKRDIRGIYLCGTGSVVDSLESLFRDDSPETFRIDDWKTGVMQAVRDASSDETVVLSPAGTSFDHFENYKKRGEYFRKWTREALQFD